MTFVWTDEAVERLKTLHSQGLSGAELAARLGSGLTRSAIFGKLHRLGLTGRRSPATQVQASRLVSRASGFAERGAAAGGSAASGIGHGGNQFPPPRFNFMRKARFAAHGVSGSGVAADARAAAPRSGALPPVSPGPLPPPSLNIGIVDIGRSQCRFIAGDDGLACGHQTVDGSTPLLKVSALGLRKSLGNSLPELSRRAGNSAVFAGFGRAWGPIRAWHDS